MGILQQSSGRNLEYPSAKKDAALVLTVTNCVINYERDKKNYAE